MAAPKIDLSVIIPIYNEEMNLVPMNNRIISALSPLGIQYEIVYVNDGSKDNSLPIIMGLSEENASVKYIDFSRNFGHQIAISAGLEHAVGERIVIMDGDGQDPPELIPDLLKKSLEGFEVVYAKRKKRKGESFLKKLTAKLFYRFLANITQIEIPLDTGDFRLIHRKVQKVLLNMPEQHKYLRGQIAWIGFNSTFVEYDREERMGGNTKFTYGKMMRFATDGISGFSNWPLKVATMLGFAVSGLAFMLIIYSLYQKFFGFTEVGWTSLHISVLFLGGVQLLGIGILGEYLGRVSENVKNRPTYIVKNSNIQTLNES
ncbi:MAG: glycosyltransferase family 2 protein [Bacteroidetes bacterium]|nr:glycosyltransferase family 2 protein [Bacteroidota bacterium]MDA1223586.1 glycosyltransferase family 2 protein [Bacteroidota bacterium]